MFLIAVCAGIAWAKGLKGFKTGLGTLPEASQALFYSTFRFCTFTTFFHAA
jgi:hypothetical protein